MLNELYDLSKALKNAVITPLDWHKELKPLPNATPKKQCYKILVGSDGCIFGVEAMKEELVAYVRKWEPSNGNSFPGFNIQPLYRITDEKKKKCLKKWREGKEPVDIVALKNWCAEKLCHNWDAKFINKLAKCLGEIPTELEKQCGEIPQDFFSLKKLFERVSGWKDEGISKLFQELEAAIWKAIEKGEDAPFLLPVLAHEGSPSKKPEDDTGRISVFFFFFYWKDYPVAHERTIALINQCLLKTGATRGGLTGNQANDAFGLQSTGYENKLPEVKLPVLGG